MVAVHLLMAAVHVRMAAVHGGGPPPLGGGLGGGRSPTPIARAAISLLAAPFHRGLPVTLVARAITLHAPPNPPRRYGAGSS